MDPIEQQTLLRRLFDLRDANSTSMAPQLHVQDTLHYTCPTHHQREMDALFQRGAQFAGLSCDLPRPNTHLALRLGDVPVLLTRDGSGQVRAFLNACRHRGAPLASGRGDTASRLRCPFHAWSYELDGTLAVKPGGPEAFAELPPDCKGLIPLQAAEDCGVILVRPRHGEPIDVRHELDALAPDFAGHGFPQFAFFKEHHSTWDMNWKQPYETFLEAYHIFALHKDSLAHEVMTAPMLTDTMGPHGRGLLMGRKAPQLLERPPSEWRFSRHANLVYWIFPNSVLSMPMTGHAELWQFHPEGPGRTRVHTRFYTPKALETEQETTFWNGIVDFTISVVTREDFGQQEGIYANVKTGLLPRIHFGRNEPALIHYHHSLQRALDAATAPTRKA